MGPLLFRNRRLLAAFLIGAVASVPERAPAQATATPSPANSQSPVATPQSGERLLHFPADRSLGILSTRPAEGVDFSVFDDSSNNWEQVGEAQGDVRVKENVHVRLVVHKAASIDLGSLILLDANAIQVLSLAATDVTDDGLQNISHLTGLRRLDLQNTKISDAGLVHLRNLSKLEALFIGNTQITNQGWRHLAGLPALRSLWAYGLVEETIHDDGAKHLAAIPRLETLEAALNVSEVGLASIAQLRFLKTLYMWGNGARLSEASMEIVAGMKSLTDVTLADYVVTESALERLGRLPNLTKLSLNRIRTTPAGWRQVALLPNVSELSVRIDADPLADGEQFDLEPIGQLKKLKELSLYGYGITPEEVAKLRGLEELERLQIMPSRFASETRPVVPFYVNNALAAQIAGVPSLRNILILESIISDQGLAQLAALPQLESLSLSSSLVTDEGLKLLASHPRLRTFRVSSPYLTEDGRAEFSRLAPNIQINSRGPFRLIPFYVAMSKYDAILRVTGQTGQRSPRDELEFEPAPQLTLDKWLNTPLPLDLADLKGRVVLVVFWGGPWQVQRTFNSFLPELNRVYAKYKEQGFEVIGVHKSVGPNDMSAAVTVNEIQWPTGIDVADATHTAWRAQGFSDFYLVGHDGNVRMAGFFPRQIEQAVVWLLAEKDAGQPFSRRFSLKNVPAERAAEVLHVVMGVDPQNPPNGEAALRNKRLELLEQVGRGEPSLETILNIDAQYFVTVDKDRQIVVVHAPPRQMPVVEQVVSSIDQPRQGK